MGAPGENRDPHFERFSLHFSRPPRPRRRARTARSTRAPTFVVNGGQLFTIAQRKTLTQRTRTRHVRLRTLQVRQKKSALAHVPLPDPGGIPKFVPRHATYARQDLAGRPERVRVVFSRSTSAIVPSSAETRAATCANSAKKRQPHFCLLVENGTSLQNCYNFIFSILIGNLWHFLTTHGFFTKFVTAPFLLNVCYCNAAGKARLCRFFPCDTACAYSCWRAKQQIRFISP